MNPSDLSKELKRIAAAIENSKNPSKEIVARDLKKLVSRMSASTQIDSKEKSVLEYLVEQEIVNPANKEKMKELLTLMPEALISNWIKTLKKTRGGSETSADSEE